MNVALMPGLQWSKSRKEEEKDLEIDLRHWGTGLHSIHVHAYTLIHTHTCMWTHKTLPPSLGPGRRE